MVTAGNRNKIRAMEGENRPEIYCLSKEIMKIRWLFKLLLLFLTINLLVFSIFKSVLAQQPIKKARGYSQDIGTCEIDRFRDTIKKFKEAGLDDFLKEICFILSAKEKYKRVSHSLMHSRTDFFKKTGMNLGDRLQFQTK